MKWIACGFLCVAGCGWAQGGEATPRERELLERIAALEARLAALEKAVGVSRVAAATPKEEAPKREAEKAETTIQGVMDGYYLWNAARPDSRVNALRAYDGSANSFSLNQAGVVVERRGPQWGYRLDVMAGQAAETLQGSPANELRPQVYRHVFQAYGSYTFPAGRGLTVDFGKWASAFGPEGNYTKDQINYSRSYFFNYLPFYHMGVRAKWQATEQASVGYWLVNGANQTEDFNGFKTQVAQLEWKPNARWQWTANYANGQEERGREAGGQGLAGRTQIWDSYLFWDATAKLRLGAELDYVLSRERAGAPVRRVSGGAGYLRYQISPRVYWGQRYVRLNDAAGLFSGVRQSLNDVTATLGVKLAEGFETRWEYRRDWSNVAFFEQRGGARGRAQDTFTVGLLWWFGAKLGAW